MDLAVCSTAAVGITLGIFCRHVSKTHCCRLNQLKSKLLYVFLFIFNSNIWPDLAALQDITFDILVTSVMTFKGHSRSNVTTSLNSPYMVFY